MAPKKLFVGKVAWFASGVPASAKEQWKKGGGTTVPLSKYTDKKITHYFVSTLTKDVQNVMDYSKRTLLVSYQYISKSVQDKELADLMEYRFTAKQAMSQLIAEDSSSSDESSSESEVARKKVTKAVQKKKSPKKMRRTVALEQSDDDSDSEADAEQRVVNSAVSEERKERIARIKVLYKQLGKKFVKTRIQKMNDNQIVDTIVECAMAKAVSDEKSGKAKKKEKRGRPSKQDMSEDDDDISETSESDKLDAMEDDESSSDDEINNDKTSKPKTDVTMEDEKSDEVGSEDDSASEAGDYTTYDVPSLREECMKRNLTSSSKATKWHLNKELMIHLLRVYDGKAPLTFQGFRKQDLQDMLRAQSLSGSGTVKAMRDRLRRNLTKHMATQKEDDKKPPKPPQQKKKKEPAAKKKTALKRTRSAGEERTKPGPKKKPKLAAELASLAMWSWTSEPSPANKTIIGSLNKRSSRTQGLRSRQ